MKKIFIFILILFISLNRSSACEICGCGVGNFYMGLLPHFKTTFIGMRYSYQHYYTELASDHTQFSNDYYKTTEIWGGVNLSNRWQLIGFIPYQFSRKNSDDGVKETKGIGDISLLANYSLLHTRSNKGTENQLWIGAGMSLPTGAYHVDLTDPDANIGDANSQSGTGSAAFIINATHNISAGKFGLNTSANYVIHTNNKEDYRFGNRFTVNSIAYYRIRFAGMSVSPDAGLLYQHAGSSYFEKTAVDQTGGYLVSGSVGAEFGFNKITVGLSLQHPLAQDFADHQTSLRSKGVIHLSVAL